MKQRNVNTELQVRIRRYVEYLFEEERNGYQKGSNIFSKISVVLKQELWKDTHLNYIKNIKIFSKMFSKDFLIKLTSIIEEKNFGPEEIIINVIISKK